MKRLVGLLFAWVLVAACGPSPAPTPAVTITLPAEATAPTLEIEPTPDGSLLADLIKESEHLWETSRVTHYQIQVREVHNTWCYYDINLEVQNQQIVTGTITAHYGPVRYCWLTEGVVEEPVGLAPGEAARWTVPGLFELAREWQALAGAEHMKIGLSFDTELGYPRRLSRDNQMAVDDDMWLETLHLAPLVE